MTALRIGCLAWGSLVWDPRSLPHAGGFREDGPRLPIEFSRVSLDGRVTLVIDPNAIEIETYWVPLAVDSLAEAVAALAEREKIEPEMRSRWVGLQTPADVGPGAGEADPRLRERIGRWLEGRGLDAVVWTALPPRRPGGELARPDLASLVSHLESLEGAARLRAEEYIRRTPPKVRTQHRLRFEEIFGWTPVPLGCGMSDVE